MYFYNARYYDPLVGQFTQPDNLVADPLNPAAWNRFGYVYNSPTNYTDPSVNIPIWDILDVGFFAVGLGTFISEPTLGNLGWLALDTVGLLPLIPSLAAVRHVGKLDDVGDARRVIVELGSGDFTNLERIARNNPGARVIGIEQSSVLNHIKAGRRYPGIPELDELVTGYDAAIKAGAEIRFLDYTRDLDHLGLTRQVDEVIIIAPSPGMLDNAHPIQTAEAAANLIRPGGRIYIPTEIRSVADDMGA